MTDIGFNNIPANQRVPGIYPEVHGDQPAQPVQKTLIIAQPVGSAPAVPVKVSSVAYAVRNFGGGSMAASMAQRYLRSDPDADLWLCPLTDNGAGVAATGKIDFTHTPNENGTLVFYIGGRRVTVGVTANQAVADIATATIAAINNYVDSNDAGVTQKRRRSVNTGVKLPVTAAAIVGHASQVGLTANNAGTLGNSIDIQMNYFGVSGQEQTPKGITVAITAMSGGTTDPDTSGLDNILGDTKYDFIIQPYTTTQALNDFQTLMSDSAGRWLPSRKIFGHVFTAASFGNNGTDAETLGTSRNDQHMTIVAYETSAPTTPYDVAAAYAGRFAFSSKVDPARPTQTLAIPDILAPHRHQHFSDAVRQALLGSGLALMDYNEDRTVKILRACTTYQLDANGSPDISYRDTETLYTLMAVVRQLVGDYGAAFPRSKIVDDDVAFGPGNSFSGGLPDQPVVTTKSAKAVLVASYSRMADGAGQPIIVTDVDFFAQNLIVQRNSQDPTRFDALLPVTLASGLRVSALKIDFALQQNG
jgi:phage tail sheath gpL-like